MLTKKDFIALADIVIAWNARTDENKGGSSQHGEPFYADSIHRLADYCAAQNPRFNRERWLAYITGTCGPNGGAVKGGAK